MEPRTHPSIRKNDALPTPRTAKGTPSSGVPASGEKTTRKEPAACSSAPQTSTTESCRRVHEHKRSRMVSSIIAHNLRDDLGDVARDVDQGRVARERGAEREPEDRNGEAG